MAADVCQQLQWLFNTELVLHQLGIVQQLLFYYSQENPCTLLYWTLCNRKFHCIQSLKVESTIHMHIQPIKPSMWYC